MGSRDQRAEQDQYEHVHFPERGIASIVATTGEGNRLEVSIFGREGMSGYQTLVLGSDCTPHKHC